MRWEDIQNQVADLKKAVRPNEPVEINGVLLPDWKRKEDMKKWSIWRTKDYAGEGKNEICAHLNTVGTIDAFVDQTEHEFKDGEEFEHFLRQNGFTNYVGTGSLMDIKP